MSMTCVLVNEGTALLSTQPEEDGVNGHGAPGLRHSESGETVSLP